jgi:O-antigen/teichoic acid export membrane protein
MSQAMVDSPTTTTAGSEALLAARNTFKLGGSLAMTWGVALLVRIWLPRHLGPALFGPLTFADAFATVLFVPLGLGVDTYIRKEVSVRPRHASDFFGGITLLRALLALALFAVTALALELTHRPPEVRSIVYVFGAGQVLVALNSSLAALLHARGRVDGLSIVSVIAKIGWAGGIAIALLSGGGLLGIAIAFLAAEAFKSVALSQLTRRGLDLRLKLDIGATWAVLVASLPFYVSALTQTAYARIDVSVLELTVDDAQEVGWYGAASSLAGLTLLATPIIGWVLCPMFARALERSQKDFDESVRRAVQTVLAIAIPTSLMVSLGAGVWTRIMFGAAYDPAAASLRLLAPVFVLTYLATLGSIALVMLGRGWTVTRISLAGMALNVGLNVALAPAGKALLGPSGGGVGCAVAMLLTETAVTGFTMRHVGRRAFDRASLIATGKSLAACLVAVAVDRVAAKLGPVRLVFDATAYLAVVIAWGALPLRDILRFTRNTLHHTHANS